jgi:uncharacterized protein (DUF983 family)
VSEDPYSFLDPESSRAHGSAVPPVPEAGGFSALVRGLRKRCPRCGERRIWEGWFTAKARCPRCDLRFEEEEGGFLGAMVLNYTLAFVVWIGLLVAVLIATVPDVPILPLLLMSAVVLIVVPLWFYPRSKMTWAAIEWLAHRTDPDYRPPPTRDPRAKGLE